MSSENKSGAGSIQSGNFQVRVHRDRCIGAGHCATYAPDVFAQDASDGLVILLNENPPADQIDLVKDAESHCPSGTIEIVAKS